MRNKHVYTKRLGQWLLAITLGLSVILPTQAKTGIFDPADSGAGAIYFPFVYTGSDSLPEPTPNPSTTPAPTATPPPPGQAMTYYLSPIGNDNNSGYSEEDAWATFDRALNADVPGNKLQPGDTLILMDGIYYQTLMPHYVGGQPGFPITIRAQNDGQAIIEGEGIRIPVFLESWRQASYFIIEGIVAKNSSGSVYQIYADHNVLRRVSGYNADTDTNNHVFVIWSNYNLLEDCVAGGSGRKMIVIYSSTDNNGHDNIIRRCFAAWQEWDGREWHDLWPWGDGIEIYDGDNNIIENSIVFGKISNYGFSLLSNGTTESNIVSGNKILGSIVANVGRDYTEEIIEWGDTRPQPSEAPADFVADFTQYGYRVGFNLRAVEDFHDNLLQDIFAWGGAGLGLAFDTTNADQYGNSYYNNQIIRATIINNGLDASYYDGGLGTDILHSELSKLQRVRERDQYNSRHWWLYISIHDGRRSEINSSLCGWCNDRRSFMALANGNPNTN